MTRTGFKQGQWLALLAGLLGGLLCALALGQAKPASAEEAEPSQVSAVLWQPAMNTFRRHTAPARDMFNFYSDVLGFELLGTFEEVGNDGVTRFQVGPGELKLTGQGGQRNYVAGGVTAATGLRLLTFFYPEQASLEARFREHGYDVPAFSPLPGGSRVSALVQDPDGQWVQLIIAPGEDDSVYEQMEVGLTVSDLEASQRFYAEFVGLETLEPVYDPLFDTRKYAYRHGATIISLRQFDADLPSDTGSGGIQYVVSDIHLVNELVEKYEVTVDQPLNDLEGFDSLLFIWVDDPDGITNYFIQTPQSTSGTDWAPH